MTSSGFAVTREVMADLDRPGCLLLVATLPWPAVVGGAAVFAVGVAYRLLRRHG